MVSRQHLYGGLLTGNEDDRRARLERIIPEILYGKGEDTIALVDVGLFDEQLVDTVVERCIHLFGFLVDEDAILEPAVDERLAAVHLDL